MSFDNYYAQSAMAHGNAFAPSYTSPYNSTGYRVHHAPQAPSYPYQIPASSSTDPYAMVPYPNLPPPRPAAQSNYTGGTWTRDATAPTVQSNSGYASRPEMNISSGAAQGETRRASKAAKFTQPEPASEIKVIRRQLTPSPAGSVADRELQAREAALRDGLFKRMSEAKDVIAGSDGRHHILTHPAPPTSTAESSSSSMMSKRSSTRKSNADLQGVGRTNHHGPEKILYEAKFVPSAGRVQTLSPASTRAPSSVASFGDFSFTREQSAVARASSSSAHKLGTQHSPFEKDFVASSRTSRAASPSQQAHAYVETVAESDDAAEYSDDSDAEIYSNSNALSGKEEEGIRGERSQEDRLSVGDQIGNRDQEAPVLIDDGDDGASFVSAGSSPDSDAGEAGPSD